MLSTLQSIPLSHLQSILPPLHLSLHLPPFFSSFTHLPFSFSLSHLLPLATSMDFEESLIQLQYFMTLYEAKLSHLPCFQSLQPY